MTTVVENTPPSQANSVSPDGESRTWTIVHRDTGERMTFTCLPGCDLDHNRDVSKPVSPDDIWCQTPRTDVTLPINENGTPEEFRVLGITLNVRPWDASMSQRLPHASIEVIDDCWIEGLDPDALANVIDTLAERVNVLRESHAQLVKLRAEYRARP
ncbi:DUF6907 domain-containing protein [Streptomyces sp. NPDC001741]|uniref:DUF6907 domain-containing protein n=1 Tax=Streptomyces sp. NPDC001741 TaxID=3364605 RepID=UPI0036921F08